MTNINLVFIVCLALALSIFSGINALFRSQISKRNYFLLMQTMISVYLVGHLLKITSANAEEAFAAAKVMYIGFCFAVPFVLFFVADYFNFKLHPVLIKLPVLVQSLTSVIIMWSTKSHGLIYRDYHYAGGVSERLIFGVGPLYPATYAFPVLYMLLTFGLLLYHIKKWKKVYRTKLVLLFVSLLFPFMTSVIYLLSTVAGINTDHANLAPHSLLIMNLCLYLVVMRYNIFEIISMATVSAIEYIKEGFILVDENNNYLSSNPAAAKVFPELAKLPRGESIYSVRSWPEELREIENNPVEFSIQHESISYFRASVSPIFSKTLSLMAKIILFSDVTDSVTLMKQLENAACIDSLTSLYNRKHFSDLANVNIKRALRLKQPMYLGMLDLDFFKKINDTYGHSAGDLILKTTADIIRNTIRSYDLVGRYGGEEFVFLITDMAPPPELLKLVERIRTNIENHVAVYDDIEIKFTCSIGVTQFLEDDTLETSLKRADIALYVAKNAGRNQVKLCNSLIESGST